MPDYTIKIESVTPTIKVVEEHRTIKVDTNIVGSVLSVNGKVGHVIISGGGSSEITGTAVGDMPALRACYPTGIGFAVADPTDIGQMGVVSGISRTAALDGDDFILITAGEISDSGWNWDLSLPIFIGANGILTQTVPLSGFIQQIGSPTSSQSIIVRLGTSISII